MNDYGGEIKGTKVQEENKRSSDGNKMCRWCQRGNKMHEEENKM